MKVLVLQLARLGDIFQTWPTFRALQRNGDEVHVLVRPRFRAAAEGNAAIARIHEFETEKILGPVIEDARLGLRASLEQLDSLLFGLDAEKFDRVINLSFSPLSSWITFDLERRAQARGQEILVSGYSRHLDGALAIPDDASAYFFAQVGYRVQTGSTESINRLSIPRLFATIAGVDPVEADWSGPDKPGALRPEIRAVKECIAIHIGASEDHKTLTAEHWGEVAARLFRSTSHSVVLLGAPSELAKAHSILEAIARRGIQLNGNGDYTSRVISLVGQTSVADLFEIVRHSKVLIGGDSALVQVASLVATPVLNLSSRTVSHWETGPASKGSRVLLYGGAAPATDTIIREVTAMLANKTDHPLADRVVDGPIESVPTFTGDGYADFTWKLISAIYLGTPFPTCVDSRMAGALEQWCEIQNIENFQLTSLQTSGADLARVAPILDRIDQVTRLVVEAEPRLSPIERWWSTEKIRLGPQPQDQLVARYLKLNTQLETVLCSLRELEGVSDGQQLDI